MSKWLAILLIYLGSCCYTIASFYHLSFGSKWSFGRAYFVAITLVMVEYVFNVLGNKGASEYITVFEIMLLIIGFDIINLILLNWLVLKNPVRPWRNGLALALIIVAIVIASENLRIT